MARILIATDAPEVRDELVATLADGDYELWGVDEGRRVRRAVAELDPELVVLDAHIGTMGGIACTVDLRLEADAGRLRPTRVLLLLDRRADVFTAKRARVDGFVVRPASPVLIRTAVREVLEGGVFIDHSYQPVLAPVPASSVALGVAGAAAPEELA
ncbi:response regulator receiver protein [Acidimicrobium ferrooxidans DSM 10331]|uniref:Response regulator receiver protein n=1 Tax=Acidimicrobium ferrooxidans (strain DSM 10331 / JCM 15462 / NBRC 103882 / ICP) TaxID=525909 RepID=C7M2G1_ACIFD|nr:response regulator [Acidimicrobium ferrooxidans]ACU53205.1 response regulator receiver protein [Acidimicrobium ferrooxidans DSM 10331]